MKNRLWLDFFSALFPPPVVVQFLPLDNYFLVRNSYLLHILFNLKTSWDFRLVLKFSILSYTWVHFDWYRYKVHVTIQEKHYRLVERQVISKPMYLVWDEFPDQNAYFLFAFWQRVVLDRFLVLQKSLDGWKKWQPSDRNGVQQAAVFLYKSKHSFKLEPSFLSWKKYMGKTIVKL